MKSQAPVLDYVLGLDIGTNSVGWAAMEQKDGKHVRLLPAGDLSTVETNGGGLEPRFSISCLTGVVHGQHD